MFRPEMSRGPLNLNEHPKLAKKLQNRDLNQKIASQQVAVEDDAFYTQQNKDALDMFNTVKFYNDYNQSDNAPMPQRDE
jgi:hypothetical protein